MNQSSWSKQFRGQMLLLTGINVVLMMLVGALGFWSLRSVSEKHEIVDNQSVPLLDFVSDFNADLNNALRNINLAFVFLDNDVRRAYLAKESEKSLADAEETFSKIQALPKNAEAAELWTQIEQKFPLVKSTLLNAFAKIKNPHTSEDELEFEKNFLFEGNPLKNRKELVEKITKLNQLTSALAYQAASESQKVQIQSQFTIGLTVVLGVLITLIVGLIFVRYVEGLLKRIFSSIRHVEKELLDTSYQLGQSSESLASSSTESAASLEEMVASMEEIVSLVRMNNEHAKESQKIAELNQSAAQEGAQMMNELKAQMEQIKKQADQIQTVTTMIDDIAFQTNLLALNAAVEAARAGEQGRGFAVVAEAVRGLSHKSAESVKEIEQLIHQSQSQIQRGYEIVESVYAAFSHLADNIKKAKDINTELATSSQEQASGLEQISTVMNTIDQAVQKNAAQGEQLRSISGHLNEDMKTLERNLAELAGWLGQKRSDSSLIANGATPYSTSSNQPKEAA